MKTNDILIAKCLTLSGTLPLVFSVILVFIPIQNLNPIEISINYGAIIITFLCGIHWATYFYNNEKIKLNLLILSNILALIAFAIFFLKDYKLAYLIEIICFSILLIFDFELKRKKIIETWFFNLRVQATIIVCTCLTTLLIIT